MARVVDDLSGMEAEMTGASSETRRVKILNANWSPSDVEGDGHFNVLIVTEDDERYVVPATPASMAALASLAAADTVMAWDPTNRVLIVANIVGTMPWTVSESGRQAEQQQD